MVLAASATLKAAIASPARDGARWLVTMNIGGVDYDMSRMVTACEVDRTPQDQTIRASQISGTIAAQANITLQGWDTVPGGDGFVHSDQLSIYKAGFAGMRDNDYGIDAKVTIRQGFQTTAGFESVQIFVGYVDKVSVGDDESISFLCLDFAGRLQGVTHLPAVVMIGAPIEV